MTNPLFVRRLTDAEKETLQQWLVSEDGERARRAQVILESSSGKTAFEIGQKLGFHPDNLKKWIRKFNQTGLGGIEVLKRGPRSRFTAEQIDKILTLYNKSPLEQGFTFSTWTPQKLAFAAVKKGIVSEISHVTVRQLISKDLGSENISSNLLQENVEDFSVRNGYTGKFDGAKPKVPIWNSLNPLSAAIRSNMTVAELISLGQSALRKSDNEEAARIFGQVLTRTEMTAEQEAQARAGLSEAYEELGESEQMLEVLSIYEEATARSTLPPKFQALVKLRLGWAYSKLSNFAKAIARFNEARPIYFEVDDQEGIAAVYYALGYAYIEINEFDLARSYLLKALENLRFSSDGKLIARIYINLGLVSYVEGDFEGAKVSYLKGQEYTKGLNDPVLHGLISMNLGSVYVNYGKQTEASEYFELAVKEFTRSGQKKYLTLAYNNLGNNLMQCGRWSEATLSLNNALSLARELEDKRNAGLTLVTLGELRFQQGDYERSEEALLSAIEILQDNDKWAEVDAQRVLGRLYFVTNRPEKSLRTLREALQLATRIGNLYEVCLCHLALAEYHFFQEEYKQAEVYLELAKENLKGKHDPDLSANGWAQRLAGKLAMAKQTFEEAKQYISASINIFASINDKYQLASSRLEMGLLCMQIGDFIASREHLTEAQQIFIELGAQTSIARIDELLLSLEKGELPQKRRLVEVKQNDVLLMQRLIEAATSRDILLKELATIIYENFASERVVIFESLNNKPIAPSVFLGCRQIEVDKLKEEFANAISMGRNHLGQATINLLEDRTNNRVWLYFEPKTTSSIDTSRMKPLLKQSELALENCSLRALTRSAVQVTDKSRIQTLIPGFIYASAAMCDVVERIQKIRTSDTNVLITGESGTGKDVIARAVHAESARRDAIFLPFNCTATPKELIESQLFGHRKGAFTGATSNYQGIIRAAEGGTLFLDEIGDLSLEIQPKLLRFLEAGEIQPLGEPKPLKVDVRVLAATNADLERAVQEGRFREDLHYRLNIIRIHVPPLRERREEIPLLTSYYLQHFANRSAKKNVTISQEALECLTNYNWPGNIRQLKTEIERVMAYSTDDTVIVPDDLSPEIARTDGFENRKITTPSAFPSIPVTQNSSKPKISKNSSAAAKNLKEATELLEKQMIEEALERNDFNISRTARDLGLSRRGLRLKMFQYDLVDQ